MVVTVLSCGSSDIKAGGVFGVVMMAVVVLFGERVSDCV